ncbi:MAG: hypothetical protein V7K38_02880 [Nostoc sp.]|uniref:hypothetical protein n=1 Tax=Nostoc sp. TaxID=1180 RepID=UPI002FF8AF8A
MRNSYFCNAWLANDEKAIASFAYFNAKIVSKDARILAKCMLCLQQISEIVKTSICLTTKTPFH